MSENSLSLKKLIWDEEKVKDLLFEPEKLVADENWNTWVKNQGGFAGARDLLRSLVLSEKDRKMLQVILTEPDASLQRYAVLLHTSVATFVRHRGALLKMLAASLNTLGSGKTPSAIPDQPPPNNLPQRMVTLIGREQELETIRVLLSQEDVAVVTITGPGGIGKTRLSLQTAFDCQGAFADGVFFVSLASITTPDLVASTIVQTLGLSGADSSPAQDILRNYLQDKHMLLVLDNFEQVTAAASLLAALLNAAPRLKMLVTSRAVLHIYGEREFRVPPLLAPDLGQLPALEKLAEFPAVALFVTRAQAAKTDFLLNRENAPIIAEICVRLDGIPLALELAAARSKLFAPPALLRELNQRFAMLAYKSLDREVRHQTLRNTVAWSYQLLGREERLMFEQLGVFVGGCTLEAVEAVCVAENVSHLDVLFSLVDQSMIQHETRPNGEPRFSLLESLREYALEQLEQTGQTRATQERHLAYMLNLVETIEPGPQEPNLPAWMNHLEEEHDNLRAAIRRALDWGETESALRIAGAIWRFWQIHGHVEEGAKWMREILTRSAGQVSLARAKALWGAGWLGMVMGSLEAARAYFEEGAQCSRVLNNPRYLGLSLHGLGAVARAQGDFASSRAAFEESLPLFQSLQNTEDVAWTFEHLGATALDQGEFQQAAGYLQQGLTLFRQLDQRWPCAEALTFLGHAALQQADYAQARQRYEEARIIYQELDDRPNVATLNISIGVSLFGQGEREKAVALYKENLVILRELNSYWGMVWGVERLAEAAENANAAQTAVLLYGAAETLRQKTGVLWHPGFHSQYHIRRFDSLKTTLGEPDWQRLWDEGRAMTVDEAITCALGL